MVSLALGACVLGRSVLAGGHRHHFVLLAMVAIVVVGFFSWHLIQIQLSSPFPLRSLHVAALLAYGAVLLAAALRLLRVADEARALLLAFSIAVPLFLADALVPPPSLEKEPRWHVRTLTDPHVGFRYRPNSTGKTYYPDNPRDYFSSNESPRDSWAARIQR